jgi:hypothetical protein
MITHPTALKRSFLAVFLTGLALGPAWGQAADSPIVFVAPDAITTTFVDPPQLGNTSGGSSDRAQWLKVEFHYACAPKAPATFLDSVEFRVWIEGRDLFAADAPTAEGIPVALTGTVTYVNIAASKDVYGVFYVHPATLARYSTKQGSTDFERRFNVHIEAYVGGAKMDFFDKSKEQDLNWFTQLRVISGLVYRQDQCPFLVSDVNRYPPIRLSTPAQ